MTERARRLRALLAPLPALLLGLGLHRRVTGQLAAACAAALLGLFAARRDRRWIAHRAWPLALASLALLAATQLGPGIAGVHRWVGPAALRAHASAIVSPWIIAVVGVWASTGPRALALAVGATALHAAQPDAAQATAVALGTTAAMHRDPWRAASAVLTGALAAWTWSRPDPLPAVAAVEGVVRLAHEAWGAAGLVAALGAMALIPLAAMERALHDAWDTRVDDAVSLGLAAYLAGVCLAPAYGNFPVPVMGYGASHLVGVSLALGLAAGARHGRPQERAAG